MGLWKKDSRWGEQQLLFQQQARSVLYLPRLRTRCDQEVTVESEFDYKPKRAKEKQEGKRSWWLPQAPVGTGCRISHCSSVLTQSLPHLDRSHR